MRDLVLSGVIVLGSLGGCNGVLVNCSELETPLARGPLGQQVLLVQRFCDGAIGTDEAQIDIVPPSGRRATAFSYVAAHYAQTRHGEADPTVMWTDQKTLRISIGVVHSVNKKVTAVDGTRVEYSITTVLDEDPVSALGAS